MGIKREFAFHMRHKKTLEHRIVKVEAETVNQAHSDEVGYKKEWMWSGSEPWKNVADKVECIGGNHYRLRQD